ncbi:MAG: DUF885 domain-containing protein, partial [Bacteroidota bacterium]
FYQFIKKDHFYLNDAEQLKGLFAEKHKRIQKRLGQFYPTDQTIPPLQIKQGQSARLVQTPGYYRNSTFFFNLFDYPFNLRQIDFLYMHEGIPGHHYQISYANQLNTPAYRQFLSRSGYAEGWGAYIEDHGEDLGLYQTPYDYLGKWEWDIVRSVRVALDVGLNYYGWSNDEALKFWKQHIPNQDEIAQREIDRMIRWPAQVHTYKIGAVKINELRQQEEKRLGIDFNPVAFHKQILQHGAVPVEVLPLLIQG